MAFIQPAPLRLTGDIVTAAEYNETYYYNVRYFKGQDGAVVTEDDLTVDNLITAGLVDGVDVQAHKLRHQNAGADEVDVVGLSGLLADDQHVLDAEVVAVAIAKTGSTGLQGDFDVTDGQNIAIVGDLSGAGAIYFQVGQEGVGPKWQVEFLTGELTMGSIPNARLKNATGSSSFAIPNTAYGGFTLQDWCFFPSITCAGGTGLVLEASAIADPANTVAAFDMHNISGGALTPIVRYRYLTASGNPEIWIGLNRAGEIIAVWEAEDPAPISPPIKLEGIVSLIKFNPDLKTFKMLREKTKNPLSKAILEGKIIENKLIFSDFGFEIEIKPSKIF